MKNSQRETYFSDRRFQYLLSAHDELRDELKMRIQQRDSLAIQFIVITGVLLSIVFTDYAYTYYLILLIPLVTLFFSVQIFSSYEVHDRLVIFIREHIESRIGKEMDASPDEYASLFWEHYCKQERDFYNIKNPGGRKHFFEMLLKIVPILCSVLYFFKSNGTPKTDYKQNLILSIGTLILYTLWGNYYLYKYNKLPDILQNNKLASCNYKKHCIKKSKKQKAVFFDRDGTLHVDKVETTLKKGLELFPDTVETLQKLHKDGYLIIVVTNQSGIAKNHITLKDMKKFNRALRRKTYHLIDAIYYCPHQAADHCLCMKPKSGMLDRAKREFHIDMKKSFLVGDKISDIMAAKNAGIPSSNRIMVATGIYKNKDYHTEPHIQEVNPVIVKNLQEAANYIVKK